MKPEAEFDFLQLIPDEPPTYHCSVLRLWHESKGRSDELVNHDRLNQPRRQIDGLVSFFFLGTSGLNVLATSAKCCHGAFRDT